MNNENNNDNIGETEAPCSGNLNSRTEKFEQYSISNRLNNSQQKEKKIDYCKIYKKFHLLNLNNNEENLQIISEEFFGHDSTFPVRDNFYNFNNFNDKKKEILLLDRHVESKKERGQKNYLTKFLKNGKATWTKDDPNCQNCQFCLSSKIYSLSAKEIVNKYKTSMESYNAKVINDIIFNENTNVVSIFKDYLIYDDVSEFLKRFYKIGESMPRLPKIYNFYNVHLKLFPTSYNLPEGRIIQKYKKKEQTKNEENEEKEDNLDKNLKRKISRDLFGEDDKIFNSKFLNELNKPEDESYDDDFNNKSNNKSKSNSKSKSKLNSKSNSISVSYLKDLKDLQKDKDIYIFKNFKKDEKLMKEESNLKHLLSQIGESNSKIFNSFSFDSKLNQSIEKRNSEIITEFEKFEKFRENPNLEGNINILKRNQSLKSNLFSQKKISRPAVTNTNREEAPNIPSKNNNFVLQLKNFQTNTGRIESKGNSNLNLNLNLKQNIPSKELVDIIIHSRKNQSDKNSFNDKNNNLKNIRNTILTHSIFNSKDNHPIPSLNAIPQKKNLTKFDNQRKRLNLINEEQKRNKKHFLNQQANSKRQINIVKQKSQPNLKIREIMKTKEIFNRKNSQPQSKNSISRPIQNQNIGPYNNKLVGPVININFLQNDFLQIRPAIKSKNPYSLRRYYSTKNIIYKANNPKKLQINIKNTQQKEIKDLGLNRIINKRLDNQLDNVAFYSKFDNSKGFTNILNSPSNSNHKISIINNLYINNNLYGSAKRQSLPINKKLTIF